MQKEYNKLRAKEKNSTLRIFFCAVACTCKKKAVILHAKLLTRELKENEKTNKKESRNSLSCEPAGARTQDPILKRDVLYLLSY